MKHIFLILIMMMMSVVSLNAFAKTVRNPTKEDAVVALAKQCHLDAVMTLFRSGLSSEDYAFLESVFKKNKKGLSEKSPFGITAQQELTINGKAISFKKNEITYRGRVIPYNRNQSLRMNAIRFSKLLRPQTAFDLKSLFIQEAAAQSAPDHEEISEAAALAAALTHIDRYVGVENGAYRLKAGWGEDQDIYKAMNESKRTIEAIRCIDTETQAFLKKGLATMAIYFKNGDRMDFNKFYNAQTGSFDYILVTSKASGERTELRGNERSPMAAAMKNFCDSPEDVRNEYVRGLQDIQLRNGDSGGTTVGQ